MTTLLKIMFNFKIKKYKKLSLNLYRALNLIGKNMNILI